MTMMRTKCGLAGLMMLGLVLQVAATEGGGSVHAGGSEGFMTGALPPPGQYFINYAMYYSADSFKGNDGHTKPNDFDLHAFADVLRFINVTDVTILGGNWAQHVCVPVVWEEVGVTTPLGARLKDKNFGLGNIDVDPFLVGWHDAPFYWVLGLDTFLPVGKYHDNGTSLANPGRNYWTFEPAAAITYLNQGGQELSAKMMYDFNTENEESEYLSGQEFHTDFVAAQHFGPWAVGAGGYWYFQTTDDRGTGATLGDNLGRQIALGPQVRYEFCALTFSLAWDHEFDTKNKPQGNAIWFKVIVPL